MKGIIFDLDGTLLDTGNDLTRSVNQVLEDYGYPLTDRETTLKRLGHGFAYLIAHSLPEETPEDIRFEALEKFVYYYDIGYMEETVPYPGIPELLQRLQEEGYALAINSNKADHYTKELIRYYFPEISFKAVFGMREGVPGKPDPHTVNEILQIMDLKAEEVLYVGDSGTDTQTAKNAGCPFLGVTWGFRSEEQLKEAGTESFAREAEDIHKRVREDA
ncbi:MAG: HAD family hydrolase [Erysipelotrichaceae bacterium]|nr:HAD family hydrolase [Erysipelotrichaceae bacterium]